ncbi:MAG: lysophospholipase [Bdellovibrio sp.]|nr:lysophospholipase [Bdellovibrio sp.]
MMYERSELFFTGYDGAKLFMQKWSTKNAVGTILFTHGQAEHSDCYHRLIDSFSGTGWSFIGWDLRGHGKSEGLRGYAKDFNEFVSDYSIFLDKCLSLNEVNSKPVLLLGHSMGGLIQTCGLLENKYSEKYPNIAGQILSSPLFGVAIDVPVWKDSGATFINALLPKLTMSNEIKNEQLTRDVEVMREYEADTYRHGRISSGVYLGFKREFPIVLARASEIKLPSFLSVSDSDPVISSEAALKAFDLIDTNIKGLKIIEGGRHELYNDICRQDVFKAVIDFADQFRQTK